MGQKLYVSFDFLNFCHISSYLLIRIINLLFQIPFFSFFLSKLKYYFYLNLLVGFPFFLIFPNFYLYQNFIIIEFFSLYITHHKFTQNHPLTLLNHFQYLANLNFNFFNQFYCIWIIFHFLNSKTHQDILIYLLILLVIFTKSFIFLFFYNGFLYLHLLINDKLKVSEKELFLLLLKWIVFILHELF